MIESLGDYYNFNDQNPSIVLHALCFHVELVRSTYLLQGPLGTEPGLKHHMQILYNLGD